jgi:hypothetical protein
MSTSDWLALAARYRAMSLIPLTLLLLWAINFCLQWWHEERWLIQQRKEDDARHPDARR